MLGDVTLAAVSNLHHLLGAHRQASRPVLIGGALLGAGALAALAHWAGDELKVWLASGQNGFVPAVIGIFSQDTGGRPG
jgi:hypothetical protein